MHNVTNLTPSELGRDDNEEERSKSMTTTRSASASGLHFVPDFLGRVSSRVTSYVARSRAERMLEGLDDHMLADIGVRRSEIHQMVWGA
jgi:uncharacterized protein YjiS (DUF1127 family)